MGMNINVPYQVYFSFLNKIRIFILKKMKDMKKLY